MHSSPVALCVLVVVTGTAFGQNPATTTLASQNAAAPNPSSIKVMRCPSAASTPDNCISSDEDNGLTDLSPTQWLFGKQQDKKLAQPSFHSASMARARMVALAVMPPQPTAVTPEYAALLRLLVLPAAPGPVARPVRELSPAERMAVEARAGRFLVEEWRDAELAVADSVHHSVLLQIGATYDSAEAAGVSGQARTEVLARLDRLARANQYSWYLFRSQVNLRADSAIAAGAAIESRPTASSK